MLSLLHKNHIHQALASSIDHCKSMAELKQIHALIIALGLSSDYSVTSKILSFSAIADSGDIEYADKLFRFIPNPTIFSWNTIIRGYSKSKNNPNRSISIFSEMLRLGIHPDHLTFPFLARSCARISSLRLGLVIHDCILKSGFEFDRFVRNSLIHMYASCGHIVSAQKLFDEMHDRNLVSWNAMVDGYAKCGNMVAARETFELMPERDVVSWSSLIDGYVKDGNYREALSIFMKMQIMCPKANEVTMVSVLCACAHLGALEQGKMMHEFIKNNELPMTMVLRTSLVDMYAKCGAIREAFKVFRGASVDKTDVLIWNSMIGGFSNHGYHKEALELFEEMQSLRIIPDEITYLCLLSACAHGGLVEEAWRFFKSLAEKHGMTPMLEHYACMVDVLGRAGRLDEACDFLNEMPVEPTASMLGALVSGCLNRGRLDLAEELGRKLIELEPDHDGRYICLSNVYAVARRWDDAKRMREAMEKRGVKKCPGCSSVEVGGLIHMFIAHDKTHTQASEIYFILHVLVEEMKLDYENEIEEDCFCELEKENG